MYSVILQTHLIFCKTIVLLAYCRVGEHISTEFLLS